MAQPQTPTRHRRRATSGFLAPIPLRIHPTAPNLQSRRPVSTHNPSRRATIVAPVCTILTKGPPETKTDLRSQPVPGLDNWRFIGPPLHAGALPAVIYFALTAEQSIELDPFNQFVRYVLSDADMDATCIDAAGAPCRVFSVTLPYHTSDMRDNENAFTHWASVYEHGGDLVGGFVRRVSESLNELIANGYICAHSVYAAGLSRGGLMAAHLAVRNEHVCACLGFAPVTVLSDLVEFSNVSNLRGREKMDKACLLHDDVVQGLAPLPVRFYMGNFDRRVGTRNAFELTHLLAERAVMDLGVRSPPHEFVMYCSVGKEGHGTPADVFCAGADYILGRMKAKQRGG